MTTTTLTLEYVRSLYNNPEVIAEAARMDDGMHDYSTLPIFNGNIGMYNYFADGVWLVDTTNSGCNMGAAIKLMRVL